MTYDVPLNYIFWHELGCELPYIINVHIEAKSIKGFGKQDKVWNKGIRFAKSAASNMNAAAALKFWTFKCSCA
jgi:hypothetical protein